MFIYAIYLLYAITKNYIFRFLNYYYIFNIRSYEKWSRFMFKDKKKYYA